MLSFEALYAAVLTRLLHTVTMLVKFAKESVLTYVPFPDVVAVQEVNVSEEKAILLDVRYEPPEMYSPPP